MAQSNLEHSLSPAHLICVIRITGKLRGAPAIWAATIAPAGLIAAKLNCGGRLELVEEAQVVLEIQRDNSCAVFMHR